MAEEEEEEEEAVTTAAVEGEAAVITVVVAAEEVITAEAVVEEEVITAAAAEEEEVVTEMKETGMAKTLTTKPKAGARAQRPAAQESTQVCHSQTRLHQQYRAIHHVSPFD